MKESCHCQLSKVTKHSRLQIFSESSPMSWGPSPSWASFWLSSAWCREWRRRWCHSPVIVVVFYFHPICAGVGRGPTYQSSKPWSEFHDNGAAKHNLGHPEEHHIQPTLPGGDAYISKFKFVKTWNVQIFVSSSDKNENTWQSGQIQKQLLLQAGEQVGAVSSVEEASLVRRWEIFRCASIS